MMNKSYCFIVFDCDLLQLHDLFVFQTFPTPKSY